MQICWLQAADSRLALVVEHACAGTYLQKPESQSADLDLSSTLVVGGCDGSRSCQRSGLIIYDVPSLYYPNQQIFNHYYFITQRKGLNTERTIR